MKLSNLYTSKEKGENWQIKEYGVKNRGFVDEDQNNKCQIHSQIQRWAFDPEHPKYLEPLFYQF